MMAESSGVEPAPSLSSSSIANSQRISPASTRTNPEASNVSSPTSKEGPLKSSAAPPKSAVISNASAATASSKLPISPPPPPLPPPKVSLRPAIVTPNPPPAASRPVNKMAMSNVITPGTEPPKLSMTTKEWVIPPRPKPGRKPATDTPPTKRKAQNRAAQRAFRERRAARVGELEEQLEEQREEHEKLERELNERAQGLEVELQTFKARCVLLESMLERERMDRARTEAEIESLRRKWNSRGSSSSSSSAVNDGRTGSLPGMAPVTPNGYAMSPAQNIIVRQTQSIQAPRNNRDSVSSSTKSERRGSSQPFSISQIISPPEPSDMDTGCASCGPTGSCACAEEILANANIDGACGKCSLGSRCECLEQILAPSGMQQPTADLKRSHPPQFSSVPPDEKRPRTDARPMESNFTGMYSNHTNQQPVITQPPTSGPNFTASTSQPPAPLRDSCGFCEEGTYCMCAEAASAALSQPPIVAPVPIPSALPISAHGSQTQTPPPSENDAVPPPMEVTSTGAIKLPGFSSVNKRKPLPPQLHKPTPIPATEGSRCGESGPGTCAQCLSDPRSGLFCRSLAANFTRQGGPAQGSCCGGSAGGGCCKGTDQPPKLGLSLSCADAYKTLSTHKNFEQASDDIGSWLPKLRAQPIGRNGARTGGLMPIEVEAASIMSVLKEFDVRFGRGQ